VTYRMDASGDPFASKVCSFVIQSLRRGFNKRLPPQPSST
jgi:hypothetical protein